MNKTIRIAALAALVAASFAAQAAGTSTSQGQGMGQGQGQGMGQGGQHNGRPPMPPPEAIKACENKAAQAACSFTGRRGETVSGQCMTPPDKDGKMPMACCPPHGPDMGGGMQGGMGGGMPPQQGSQPQQ